MSFPKQIDDLKIPTIEEYNAPQERPKKQVAEAVVAATATAGVVASQGVYVSSFVIWLLAGVILILLIIVVYLATNQKATTSANLDAVINNAMSQQTHKQDEYEKYAQLAYQQPSSCQIEQDQTSQTEQNQSSPSSQPSQPSQSSQPSPSSPSSQTEQEIQNDNIEYAIERVSTDGNVIETFLTKEDIFKHDGKLDYLQVIKCCNGEINEYEGFIYRYKK